MFKIQSKANLSTNIKTGQDGKQKQRALQQVVKQKKKECLFWYILLHLGREQNEEKQK